MRSLSSCGGGGANWFLYLFLAVLAGGASAGTVTAEEVCPVRAPGEVSARVETEVRYRADQRRFDYRYRIHPDTGRARPLTTVALKAPVPPANVRGPDGWWLTRMGPSRVRLFWDARSPSSPSRSSPMQFSFQSALPPGPGNILLLGHLDYRDLRRRILEGGLPPTCAPWFSGTFRDQARAVAVVLPDTFVFAGAEVSPGEAGPGLDPDSGREVAVVLTASDTLPLERLVKRSVRVGPALVRPRWSSGHRVDVDGDRRPDRLFHVRVSETGLRCGHDHLIVTGWLKRPTRVFLGRVSVRLSGCP